MTGRHTSLVGNPPYRPRMDRRRFLLTSLAGGIAAPLAAQALAATKVRRVGLLVAANPRLYDGFVDELRRLGYIPIRARFVYEAQGAVVNSRR